VDGQFPVVYVKRPVDSLGNPTDGIRTNAGGDLYYRAIASASASELNITQGYTQGQGDVSDPEVSYDGTKVVFSMRGPTDSTWNVWEYTISTRQLRRIIEDNAVANEGDDVDPVYLPDGRIVFSSNRQQKSLALMAAENKEPYQYLDEYERERVIALHRMNADGTAIEQISFNQSHDRNPTVLSTGEIMYARWDHVGGRNHFPIFTMNPDGTNTFIFYGAFSPGNSFLHPRETESGMVVSDLMPLSGTNEGGGLYEIDVRNFSENNEVAPNYSGARTQGQIEISPNPIPTGRMVSENGRFTTPYPLWDGTGRLLVSWTPFIEAQETNVLTGAQEQTEGTPAYSVYMYNPSQKTLRPLVLTTPGVAITDAIPVVPRDAPNVISDKAADADLVNRNRAILNVKSVYDTDDQDLMGSAMLVGSEVIPSSDGEPNLNQMKDPAQTTADQRPGRFVRVTRAVATPRGIDRESIGASMFEMQEIVGYAPLEPDGSFKLEVPADTPIGVSVVDSKGRAIQVHTNWIHVRPGETRTCNGCHSPRRGSALNASGIAGDHQNTLLNTDVESGESMAETATRLDPTKLLLTSDLRFTDYWTDVTAAGRPADADLIIDYSGLDTTIMSAPVNGVINYPEHIQPLWDKHCVSCHNDPDGNNVSSAGLDLRGTTNARGRLQSYDELVIGDPLMDENGRPIIRQMNENSLELEVVREPSIVGGNNSRGGSRASYLTEVLFGEELRASQSITEITTDHTSLLNASELRLVSEWIDLGIQYMNTPYVEGANDDGFLAVNEIRSSVSSLNMTAYEENVHPLMMNWCARCHQPIGGNGLSGPLNGGFEFSKFILTGSVEGDFNITASMIHDVTDPDTTALLERASSDSLDPNPLHPQRSVPNPLYPEDASNDPEDPNFVSSDPEHPTYIAPTVLVPIWDTTSTEYQTVRDWILAGP
jgi:mono/diheme cytochrome c family protein